MPTPAAVAGSTASPWRGPRLLPLGALAAGFGLVGLDALAQEPPVAPDAAVATAEGAVAASEPRQRT